MSRKDAVNLVIMAGIVIAMLIFINK